MELIRVLNTFLSKLHGALIYCRIARFLHSSLAKGEVEGISRHCEVVHIYCQRHCQDFLQTSQDRLRSATNKRYRQYILPSMRGTDLISQSAVESAIQLPNTRKIASTPSYLIKCNATSFLFLP